MSEVHTEEESTVILADRLLDEPMADPDDDLRTLARQFMRKREQRDKLAEALQLMVEARDHLVTRDIEFRARIATLEAQLTDLRRHLGTLTPGGSHTCITCAAHVKVITEDLEPRIRELEAALLKYARHTSACQGYDQACTCGFKQAITGAFASETKDE